MKKTFLLFAIGLISIASYGQLNQVGENIEGVGFHLSFGQTVSINADGTVALVGTVKGGYANVYVDIDSVWTLLRDTIFEEELDDWYMASTGINGAGNIVAVSSPSNNGGVDEGYLRGSVRVYELISDVWVQVGGDIDGVADSDLFGEHISLSADGSIIAISTRSDGTIGTSAGLVQVYKVIDDQWVQQGEDIEGEAEKDYFGSSLSLSSDGLTFAAGAQGNDGNGVSAGNVRVFNFDSDVWTQVGNSIQGEMEGEKEGREENEGCSSCILQLLEYFFKIQTPYFRCCQRWDH